MKRGAIITAPLLVLSPIEQILLTIVISPIIFGTTNLGVNYGGVTNEEIWFLEGTIEWDSFVDYVYLCLYAK